MMLLAMFLKKNALFTFYSLLFCYLSEKLRFSHFSMIDLEKICTCNMQCSENRIVTPHTSCLICNDIRSCSGILKGYKFWLGEPDLPIIAPYLYLNTTMTFLNGLILTSTNLLA